MMKFIASDVDAAKAKARRAFGTKAVVLSVRELPSGDVEITASDKAAPSAPEPVPAATYAGAARDAIDEGPFKASAGARLNENMESRFAEDAFSKLSGSLTGGSVRRPIDLSNDGEKSLASMLSTHGIGANLMAALVDGARNAKINDDLHRLESAFATVFSFAPISFSPTGPIMLVGPTGAGKTSSGAKLAATAAEHNVKSFMMTADVGRAGAIEQIKSYGEALGAEYFIVESPLDVQRIFKTHKPGGAVILDTPGVSPYDGGDVAALSSFREACNAEPVLVLPAGGDAEEYVEWAIAFREIGVRRCIVTKFDATRRIGAALRAVYEADLSLAHFSETPFISEGLVNASAEFLARRFIASRPGRITT